ncbi:MAG: trigger factor [Alphaproteobacteria bacterium]|jgi:trigger factor|nr:trigger factor [Alphaproteobacteria bacterium]MBT5390461.1 trigger factor [Alphaproteobacteria bacterium]MBT5541178.1 trigger factor [Alphaproteobacteria bacterium]MBT5655175.1 trigger factor [Alphaproteobacteria bacterium]
MKVTEVNSKGLEHTYKIVVPSSEIQERIEAKLQGLGGSVNVPGFRKGKVPLTLLKQRYGNTVNTEVLEDVIKETSMKAFQEKGLIPATQPSIKVDLFSPEQDLEYTVTVETLPEIEDFDLKGLNLEKLTVPISEDKVEESLLALAERNKKPVPLKKARSSKKGDHLLIDFVGSLDGKVFEGGTAKDFPIEIGSGNLIPGFEDQLVGAKKGDKVTVEVTFPKEYGEKSLAGKGAAFDVTVKEVSEMSSHEVNDEFASALGYKDLKKLREDVKAQMGKDLDHLSRSHLKRKILDKLSETYDIEVPATMADAEFKNIWDEFSNLAKEDDAFKKEMKEKGEKKLKDEYRSIAERRVKLGLVLADIGKKNKIDVSQNELQQALMEHVRQYPGQEQEIFDKIKDNPRALASLQAPLFEEKVIDYLIKNAKLKEREVEVAELTKELSEDPLSGFSEE